MVPGHCISRSHRLKIDFQGENLKIVDIWYVASPSGPLPSLFKLSPLAQKWRQLGGHMFNIGLYREIYETIFFSETFRPRAYIFGM